MKKGISIWSFAETDLRKCMELAKTAGFDGLELALDEHGAVSMDSTKEDIMKLASKVSIDTIFLLGGDKK